MPTPDANGVPTPEKTPKRPPGYDELHYWRPLTPPSSSRPSNTSKRREGYNHPKNKVDRYTQYGWGVIAVGSLVWGLAGAWPLIFFSVACVGQICYLEWCATCEDRAKVKKVTAIVAAAGAVAAADSIRYQAGERDRLEQQAAERRQARNIADAVHQALVDERKYTEAKNQKPWDGSMRY